MPTAAVSPVIVIHGGAGALAPEAETPAKDAAYRAALAASLEAGQRVLMAGGTAIDAVISAVVSLEDCPLFNAGHGAVFTSEGKNELDAAIMDGATRKAGAVAGVTRLKNPIRAANAVMTLSPHVMLVGPGAETFAQGAGLDIVDPSYFHTDERWQQLERARKAGGVVLDHDGGSSDDKKFGTVGAVALDAHGNVAAATSTGGMTNKQWGRVGDSPIIGAGTWADNATCALSATGQGEAFMRCCATHEVASLMRYKGLSLEDACREVATVAVPREGGTGGIIGVDRHGNIAMSCSTPRFFRGYARGAATPFTAT
ncbi:MAG: isoaspartyl peptidase/L-asparaginase [Proteobacteria bacterium]|nr:isoaspartyl peptidase/L-asparaginase [Pseudomonadota bacterium]